MFLKKQLVAHLEMVSTERVRYKNDSDCYVLLPQEYFSIILYEADQSAFLLLHFIVRTKVVIGHEITVRLIGVLDHARPEK